ASGRKPQLVLGDDTLRLPLPADLEKDPERVKIAVLRCFGMTSRNRGSNGKIAHNVLFSRSLGTGKTMLAERLPTILPPRPPAESLQTTRIDAEDGQVLSTPQVDVGLTYVGRGVPDGQDVVDHHFLIRHAGVIEPVGASGHVVDHDRS